MTASTLISQLGQLLEIATEARVTARDLDYDLWEDLAGIEGDVRDLLRVVLTDG